MCVLYKKLIVLILIISLFTLDSVGVYAHKECPELNELEVISIRDKKEVVKALKILISKTYEVGDYPVIRSNQLLKECLPKKRLIMFQMSLRCYLQASISLLLCLERLRYYH
ncbi:hypothetical protein DTO10_15740 [Peribacillus butanolivorans]|uniref:Uncharacterized protein n=1 Tax=Peribacillus butanolivorans TaxID=421767 RepID=A0ABN5N2Q2_9BACI|nr:hypothetical protein DTO10_15740 [Peribacillus butanolivorans]